eukprot:PhM_4_TR2623/c0_g1_i1/m.869/K03331/DCXR; L-xylulose reductase
MFSEKRILVTGGSSGIGFALCSALIQEGAFVVFNGSRADKVASAQERLGGPDKCLGVAADLTSQSDITMLVETAGRLDALVNNAGVAHNAPFLEATAEDWARTLTVNTTAPFLLSQAFARQYVPRTERDTGCIVNVSSQASSVGLKDHAAYCTSKGALDQLTRVSALELASRKIRVNSVNPTVVLTEMGVANWSDPEKAAPMFAQIPLQRFASCDDVVQAILFLLDGNKSGMITGVTLPVDGGFLAVRGVLPST